MKVIMSSNTGVPELAYTDDLTVSIEKRQYKTGMIHGVYGTFPRHIFFRLHEDWEYDNSPGLLSFIVVLFLDVFITLTESSCFSPCSTHAKFHPSL